MTKRGSMTFCVHMLMATPLIILCQFRKASKHTVIQLNLHNFFVKKTLVFYYIAFPAVQGKYRQLIKGLCKRTQHCWPATRNIVGPNMLRRFA